VIGVNQSFKMTDNELALLSILFCLFIIVVFVAASTPQTQQTEIILRGKEPALTNPLLTASGTKLYNGDGAEVYLRSVQVDWNTRNKQAGATYEAAAPADTWFLESDVTRIKNEGATAIEIHVLPLTYLMPTRGNVDASYFITWIDVWVEWITDAGLYCILDVTGPGARFDWEIALTFPDWLWSGLGYAAPSTQADYDTIFEDFFTLSDSTQDTNRAAFVTLWEYFADRYKDNPRVIFSLMNEPFLGSTTHLTPDNGNSVFASGYSTFMGTVIDAIRAQGANQPVIVNNPWLHLADWSWATQPINKTNIIWEVHGYLTSDNSYSEWSTNSLTGVNGYVNKFVTGYGKPLFFGEYGFDPQSYAKSSYPQNWITMLSQMTDYLDSKSLCGRQWHQWGYITGEYYAVTNPTWAGNFSSSESEQVLDIVLNGESLPPEEPEPPIEPPPQTYYTVIVYAGPNGSVNPQGTHSIPTGQSFTCVAQPNTDYNFSHWTRNEVTVSTNPVYTFTGFLEQTYVLWAYFEANPPVEPDPPDTPDPEYYSVNIGTRTGVTTDLTGTQTVLLYDQLTVTATLNTNYRFNYWLYDGTAEQHGKLIFTKTETSTGTHTLLPVVQKIVVNPSTPTVYPSAENVGVIQNDAVTKFVKNFGDAKPINIQDILKQLGKIKL
jgi:hypothetical protein